MNTAAFLQFKKTFLGKVVLPEDHGYELARTTMMRKGSPALVVYPSSPIDVSNAVLFAKQEGLVLSVRSGGHSGAGYGTNNGGIVIDLGKICDVSVIDNEQHIVRVGAGARWSEVASALQPHHLAISSGDTKSVGVGGLTLAEGMGPDIAWFKDPFGNIISVLQEKRA